MYICIHMCVCDVYLIGYAYIYIYIFDMICNDKTQDHPKFTIHDWSSPSPLERLLTTCLPYYERTRWPQISWCHYTGKIWLLSPLQAIVSPAMNTLPHQWPHLCGLCSFEDCSILCPFIDWLRTGFPSWAVMRIRYKGDAPRAPPLMLIGL